MAELKNLSILLTHESFDQASRLSSVLDNSGFKVRAHKATSKEELSRELEANAFDIVLAQLDSDSPSPKDVLQEIKRLNRDLPVILISERYSGSQVAQGIRIGAKDVVSIEEDQHLIVVVNRELANRAERSKHRDTQRRFFASEARYQQLVQFARLPMAIVHDSMLVLVNETFADLFGYDQADMELMPIFDLLPDASQVEFKEILKEFGLSPESYAGSERTLALLHKSGHHLDLTVDVRSVKFNDEDSLQLRVNPAQSSDAVAELNNNASNVFGLLSRHKLIEHIGACINSAQETGRDSSLLCIEIDGYDNILDSLGIAPTDELYEAFIEFVVSEHPQSPTTDFSTNQLLVLLPGVAAEAAQQQGLNLCEVIEKKVFEFGEHSQQITVTVGVSLISELITNADTSIKQAVKGCEQLRLKTSSPVVNTCGLFEPEKSSDDSDVDINYLLKQAFKHSHLQILFQPLLNFRGEAGKHYEVLLGIRPEHKESYPQDFIAMACRSNENHEIDRWVILEAMRTLMKKLECDGDETLFIHVSKQSLQNDKFAPWVAAALKKSRLDPQRLIFQFREVDVSSHLKATTHIVTTLKSLGCRTVITHFGSSVAPMKVLEAIPFDLVKIDGAFTLEAQKPGGSDEALLQLLEQIKERDRAAIVPMVETPSILPALWKSSVAYIQGYYVRSPGPKMDHAF